MSDEFFEKLNKGMNIDTKPLEEPATEPGPEPEPDSDPEAALTGFSQEPEIIEKKPAKKRGARKKTAKRKTSKTPANPVKENTVEVRQESSLQEDEDEDKDEIDGDVFQKEGQLTVDVFETQKDIIIQSAVAGINPEDLDISIEKDMVSIKGRRERQFEEKTENFFYQECFWGKFSREVVLPSEVDKDRAEATIKNGVLTIKIPKIHTTNNKKLNINIEE
jgi:HSP20 family protein